MSPSTPPASDELSGPSALPVAPGTRSSRRRLLAAVGVAGTLLLTAACAGGSGGAGAAATSTPASAPASPSATASPTATAATSPATGTAEVTVADAWVKATAGAQDPSMTAAFGVLTNGTDHPLTVVSATTSASDRAELHEMAMVDGAMVMRPKAGGFVIPAGGSVTLQPGGDHVMIMDVTSPVRPGDQVTVTLTLDDGHTVDFTALAKDFAGAQEQYAGPSASTGGMDMSGGMPSPSAAHG